MAQRIGAIVLGVIVATGLLVLGAVGWISWFPNTLRPLVERLVTAQLGREIKIAGPLDVGLGRVVTLDVRGIQVAAPEWAQADTIASVDHLRLSVDLPMYVRNGTIRVTEFTVEAPTLSLERDEQGRTSWPTGNKGAQPGPTRTFELEQVHISMGRISFSDTVRKTAFRANLAVRQDPGGQLSAAVEGTGSAAGQPVEGSFRVGAPRSIVTGGGSATVKGWLTSGGTRAQVDGSVADPANLGGIDLSLQVASDDPAPLMALLGQTMADPASPLSVTVRTTYARQVLALDDLHVRWGESALDGRIRLDLSRDVRKIDADLQLPVLDVVSLLPSPSTEAQSSSEPIGNPLRALVGYSGRVAVQAGEIRLPGALHLRSSAVVVNLADGRLTAAPMRIGLPEGEVEGEVRTGPLNAEELTLDTRLRASGVGLAGVAGEGFRGSIDGNLDGTVVVASPAASLARSQLRFEGSGADLATPQAEIGAVTATAVLHDGQLRLEPLAARLPQGKVEGRIIAGPFDRNFTADIALDASDVDLAAVARMEGIAGSLAGKLTGTVRGTEPLDVLTRSTLSLKGTLSGLRLPEVEHRIGKAEIDASLDPDRREALKLVAHAVAGDRTLNLTAFGGSFRTLAANDGEYPFTVVSELGHNEVKVNGTVSLPLTERRFSATIDARGPDPSPILALFELPKLQFPPYQLKGVLTNAGENLHIKDFDGRIGDSDVAADLTIVTGGDRPKIAGTLTSRVLDGDDLGGLVGATPATGPGETASQGEVAEAQQKAASPDVLPAERLDPTRWRRVDFDLKVRADKINAGKVPLDGLSGRITLDDGQLRLADMDLIVGDGHLIGDLHADGREVPIAAEVSLDLQRASVARLLNRLDVDASAFGTLSGQARGGVGLGGQGNSIKEILGRSNGEVRLQMEGGRIDRTVVAALGLDLLRLLGAATGASPDTVEMRCALASLDVRDGIITTDPLVIDTEIADLGGRGTVNLKTEAIDLSLTARPKETPLLTDLTGISIGGRLGQPEININPIAVAARGVAAATLGIVLKPFTTLAGAATDASPSPCDRMLEGKPSG